MAVLRQQALNLILMTYGRHESNFLFFFCTKRQIIFNDKLVSNARFCKVVQKITNLEVFLLPRPKSLPRASFVPRGYFERKSGYRQSKVNPADTA